MRALYEMHAFFMWIFSVYKCAHGKNDKNKYIKMCNTNKKMKTKKRILTNITNLNIM